MSWIVDVQLSILDLSLLHQADRQIVLQEKHEVLCEDALQLVIFVGELGSQVDPQEVAAGGRVSDANFLQERLEIREVDAQHQ